MDDLKEIHIGVVITIATGKILTNFQDLKKALHYMTGDSPVTSELPRFLKECEPYIKEQNPWLREFEGTDWKAEIQPGLSFESIWDEDPFLMSIKAQYGEWHKVRPIHFEDHVMQSIEGIVSNLESHGVETIVIVDDD